MLHTKLPGFVLVKAVISVLLCLGNSNRLGLRTSAVVEGVDGQLKLKGFDGLGKECVPLINQMSELKLFSARIMSFTSMQKRAGLLKMPTLLE